MIDRQFIFDGILGMGFQILRDEFDFGKCCGLFLPDELQHLGVFLKKKHGEKALRDEIIALKKLFYPALGCLHNLLSSFSIHQSLFHSSKRRPPRGSTIPFRGAGCQSPSPPSRPHPSCSKREWPEAPPRQAAA